MWQPGHWVKNCSSPHPVQTVDKQDTRELTREVSPHIPIPQGSLSSGSGSRRLMLPEDLSPSEATIITEQL